MLRALLFDFNGVLLDDEPLHGRLLQAVLAEEGVQLSEGELVRFLGKEDASAVQAALEQAGEAAPAPRVARLVARKGHYYRRRVRDDGPPFFAGAVELAREAAAAGLLLGIVSGAQRDEIEGALDRAGIRSLFKVIVAAGDVSRGKPDPDGYRLALERLNTQPPLPERLLHPHEVLAVEDSIAGLDAARAAGIVTLAVGHSLPLERLAEADAVAPGLAGLNLRCLQAICAEPTRR